MGWGTGRNAGRFLLVEAGGALRVVERVLLRVEFPPPSHLLYAISLADRGNRLSAYFGEAPCFWLATVCCAGSVVVSQRIVRNPEIGKEKAKSIHVAEWLVRQKVDVVFMHQDVGGKGPEYVLREAGINSSYRKKTPCLKCSRLKGAENA